MPSPGWSDELLEDLAAGLDALPERARAFPGEPLTVELHAEPAPWGIGDAEGRVDLYAYRDDDDARAAAGLSGLTSEQRARLWRRRAVVHAVLRRWDERLGWSASAAWRELSGWNTEGEAFVVYPWAFSRRAGTQSAALDLATFAEELLVPGGDEARCPELSKVRFLDERLAALDPAWRPARACAAFDAWAQAEHVRRVEVVFAVPSGAVGQAMFGHLLLHFVRDDESDPSDGRVVQLAALVSPFEAGSTYLLRGLTGGFRGVYSSSSFGDVEHEALGLEQRALRRFELRLTAEQRLRVLERAWELQRTGYIAYRFFTANCATMLRFLLQPALGGALRRPLTPWEAPTQVLEALEPLLTPVRLELPSGESARRAVVERRRLVAAAPRAWPEVEAMESEPLAAYRALATPGADERWRADVLLASLRIERHLLDAATVERLKIERATLLPGFSGPSTDELVAARQRRSELPDADAATAVEAELAEWLALDAQLRASPRRPVTREEQAVVDAERAAQERFTAVAEAVAALPEATLDEARAAEAQRASDDTDGWLSRAVPESGNGMAAVSAGYSTSAGPLLRVRAALLREELGDQRLRGFGSGNEWHLLDATADLVPKPGAVVSRAEVNGLSVRLLGRNGWGWGGGVDYAYLPPGHEVAGSVEGLRVAAADERLMNFLYVALALRGGVRVESTASGVVTPRAGLAARLQLPGSYANCVRLEASYRPRLQLTTAGASLEHGALGAARVMVRLGTPGGLALTARADAQVEWSLAGGVSALGLLGVEVD